jgi:hypothetical protein
MSAQRPARMIRLRSCCFGATSYLIDADQHNKEVFNILCNFYWLLDQAPGRKLQKEKSFWQWMVEFANAWGEFLNTPASITEESLQSFIDDPYFKMDQYLMPVKAYTPRYEKSKLKANGPSGWLTFNQFFAREINPGSGYV